MTPPQRLANAIILQAVDDYRAALSLLCGNANNRDAKHTVLEVEEFFRSGWFTILTGIDPEMLIGKLRAEA